MKVKTLLILAGLVSVIAGGYTAYTLSATPSFSASVFVVQQGGTGNSSFTAGNLLYGSGSNAIQTVATTSVACSGSVSCTSFTAIGASPITITGAGSSGVGNWFTPTTNYNVTMSATSTPIWARLGLFASSTSAFDQINVGSSTVSTMSTSTFFGNISVRGNASTTNLTISGIATGANRFLFIDGSGNVGTVALPLTYANGGTGTTTGAQGWAAYYGATALQAVATSTPTAGSGISITGTGAVLGTLTITNSNGYPFTPTTNYNTTMSATSTPLWARLGLYASTTSAFDQINVGSSTTSTLATSTFFGNLLTKGTASSTALIVSNTTSALLLTGASGLVGAYGGASACAAGNAVTAISAVGATTCATFSGFGFPFTPTTNYAVTTAATSTPIWARAGVMASSTSYFDNITVGSTTASASNPSIAFGGTTNPVGFFHSGSNNLDVTIAGTSQWRFSAANISALNSGKLFVGAGTAAAPAYTFAGITTSGMFYEATNNLGFSTGGIEAARFDGAQRLGLGTTTPRWNLQIATGTAPQLALSDGSLNSPHWVFRNSSGNFYLGTSSPTTFATSTFSALAISANGQLYTGEQDLFGKQGTSTSMVIDWLNTPNQVDVRIGTAGVTIGFNNASTTGMTKRIIVCNPGATASTVTWGAGQVLWAGGTAPTQTTTANKCDLYSFVVTQATSTANTTTKVFGAATQSF